MTATRSVSKPSSKAALIVGGVLLVVGLAVALVGLFMAIKPLIAMYSEALNDPMGNDARAVGGTDPLGDGKQVASSMIPGLVIMGLGTIASIAGSVMLKIGIIRRIIRARHEKQRAASNTP
ncbi:MAG: hypothetical protein AB7Q00_13760 [Phycisphaerales bacterium]